MKIGSLFSGYGGLDQAAEAAFGAETAWVSDIDPGACKILAHRYPNLPNHGDITKIDWRAVEPVDILTGGYPCQPFSAAGQRRGTSDERHLWPFVVEAMSALRPRFGLFENVRGHLSLGFDQVLRDLSILGYDTRWHVLRAADVGAPHGRARIFILATDRHVRSGSDRWGGVHRDSGDGRFLSGSPQDRDDRQGAPGAAKDAAGVRRDLGSRPQGSGPGARVPCVEADRESGGNSDRVRQLVAGREAGTSADRPSVPIDGGLLAEIAEWARDVDGIDACEGCGVSDADSGSESRRARHGAGAASCCEPAGDSSVGLLVGSGGRPLRAGGVRGALPDVGADGGGADVRDPDGFVYDADLVLVAGDSHWTTGEHDGSRSEGGSGGEIQAEARSALRGEPGVSGGDSADTTSQPGGVGHGDDVRARRGTVGRGADAGRGSAAGADGLGRERGRRTRDGRSGSTDGSLAAADALGGGRERRGPDELAGAPEHAAGDSAGTAVADASGDGWDQSAEEVRGWESQPARSGGAAADASGERHGRGEDGRTLGRVDGDAEGEARERERARAESGDRGAEAAADADSAGLSSIGRVERVERDAHGRRGADGARNAAEHETAAHADSLAGERSGAAGRGRELGEPATGSAEPGSCGGRSDHRAEPVSWGVYAPAVARWERATGRVAPAPTETSPKGSQRLSPRFVEWMMGLPEGWVTSVPDLNRNAQLKALGNGVVPQQAFVALTQMLNAERVAA